MKNENVTEKQIKAAKKTIQKAIRLFEKEDFNGNDLNEIEYSITQAYNLLCTKKDRS